MSTSYTNKMMCRYLYSIYLSFLCLTAIAQKPTVQDCLGAIPICKNIYTEPSPYAYTGEGNYLSEILRARECYTEENNGVWYTFTALSDGYFKFVIKAVSPNNEDYDWIMFDITDAECADLATNPEPYLVSSNNYGNFSNNQFTGADTDSILLPPSGNCNGPGVINGPHFNDDIPVQKGRIYVLYVSNWIKSLNGYTIDFSKSTAKIFDDTPPSVISISQKHCAPVNEFSISFSENIKCASLTKEKLKLTGAVGEIPIADIISKECRVGAEYGRNFTIRTIAPLTDGNYSLLVSPVIDICNNLSGQATVNLLVKSLKVTNVEKKPLLCDQTTGTINIQATGGQPPYFYSIDNGATNFSKGSFNGLLPGNYTVKISDVNDCFVTENVELKKNADIILSPASTKDNLCFGDSLGEMKLIATGGIEPLEFSIDGGLNFSSETTFLKLPAGNYPVWVKDQAGCKKHRTESIKQGTMIVPNATKTDLTCFANASGKLYSSPHGGTGKLTATWSDMNKNQLSQLNKLQAGKYWIKVIDENNCSVTDSLTLIQPEKLSADISVSNALCFGASNGKIKYTITGGTPDYKLNILNHKNELQNNPEQLKAGEYQIQLTDANNCQFTDFKEVGQPQELSVSASKTDLKCYGDKTGEIEINSQGGVGISSFSIDGGKNYSNQNKYSGLAAGIYSLVVKDANECEKGLSLEIKQPSKIEITPRPLHLRCFEDETGKLHAEATGGTGQLNFLWTDINNKTLTQLNGLPAGSYVVKVTDETRCKAENVVNLTQPNELQLILSKEDVRCFNETSGKIKPEALGGTPDYSFFILDSKKQSIENFEALPAGDYTIRVTDKNKCEDFGQITLNQPDELQLKATIRDVTCNGGNNGSVELSALGGIQPYRFEWEESLTEKTRYHLTAGTYSVSVNDQNGCITKTTLNVNQPQNLSLKLKKKDVSCFGQNDGSIELEINGASDQVKYNWSVINKSEITNLHSLKPDQYKLTLIDNVIGECAVDSVEILEPALLTANYEVTEAVCNNLPEGKIQLDIQGGTPDYLLTWTDPSKTGDVDIEAMFPGAYKLVISDWNQCSTTLSFEIKNDVCPPEIEIPNIFTPNGDGRNDYYYFRATYVAAFTSIIINRWGNEVYRWHMGQEGWDGNLKTGEKAAEGNFFYLIDILGQDGKKYFFKGALRLAR